jgi:FlaA1/EpsC-like NDP-sugar epimerase
MVLLFDTGGVGVMLIISYFLRFNFEPELINPEQILRNTLLVMGVYVFCEVLYKANAGLIRHTTIQDIFRIILSTTSAMAILVALQVAVNNMFLPQFFRIPLSIILIHFLSVNALLFVSRITVKMLYEVVSMKNFNRKNVVIFGAGAMGLIVKRVITSDTAGDLHIVSFLDNNRKIQGKQLEGIPVCAPETLTAEFLRKHKISTMIFAIRNLPVSEKAEVFRFAVNLGLEVLEVPAVDKWLNGQFELNQLKKISLQDLLSREPIHLNMKMIAGGLKDRTILVTGAAGSIGSEIARQLIRFPIRKLVLADIAETPLFHLQNELREMRLQIPVVPLLVDVTDYLRMEMIFGEHRPDIVFHAAAYKHVPMMEDNPHEAIRVNVGSTFNLTDLSTKYGVWKFVLVSTDKAVNPTNVMGASKRLCEKIVRAKSMSEGNRTEFVITRFGNVLGSNGSVIPIFKKQIEEGGPVTVTHPDITRYFMTIPEACQLVLEAGFTGMGGEIFVFDMGKPVRIDDLARQMIKLSGLEPGKDIRIEYTGLRPGEKLFEELLANREMHKPTRNPHIMVARVAPLNHAEVLSRIRELFFTYRSLSELQLIYKIRSIVPDYAPANRRFMELSEAPVAMS